MTERIVERIVEKLRDAENVVLSSIVSEQAVVGENQKATLATLHDCKVLIWKAMDKAGEMAR